MNAFIYTGSGLTPSVVWDSGDLGAIAEQDLTGGGTVTLGGVQSKALINPGNAAVWRFNGTSGMEFQLSTAVDYYGATDTAPQVAWDLAGLDPDVSRTAIYLWETTMASTSATPASLGEGPFGGIRTDRAVAGEDCYGRPFYSPTAHGGSGGIVARLGRGSTSVVDADAPAAAADPRAFTVLSAFGELSQLLLNDGVPGFPLDGTPAAWATADATGGGASTTVPTLDYTDAGCECYGGVIGRTSGTSGLFIVQRWRLLRLGQS